MENIYRLIFLFLFVSCSQDLYREQLLPMKNQEVVKAKFYSESSTKTYHFCSTLLDNDNAGIGVLNFDWENYYIYDTKYHVNIEVPLHSDLEIELYLKEIPSMKNGLSGKFKTSTRLVIRKNKTNNHYFQFIITKLWLDSNTYHQGNFSYYLTDNESITVIYDVDGNILSKYKDIDSMYIPFHLKKDGLNRYLFFSTDILPMSSLQRETKLAVQDEYFLCGDCNLLNPEEICSRCHQPCTGMAIEGGVVGELTIVRQALREILFAARDAIEIHRTEDNCNFTISETSFLRAYKDQLENYFDPFFISDLYNLTLGTFSPDIDDSVAHRLVGAHGYMIFATMYEHSCMLKELAVAVCASLCQEEDPKDPQPPPHQDKEQPCTDEKCPTCGKCMNPTKPNCVKCTCVHDHVECKMCHKCVRSANDACKTRSTHSSNCSTCNCVCPSCGMKIDPSTGIFGCAGKLQEVYEKYEAYRMLWKLNSTPDGNENAAFLLFDETVVINFSAKNEYKKAYVGMSYSCPNEIPGYFYVFKNANGITYPDLEMTMDAKVAIKAIVHPHPSPQDTI